MEHKRTASSSIAPIKFQSRPGKASTHLYSNLYANFSSLEKIKQDSPSASSLSSSIPPTPSPTCMSPKVSQNKARKIHGNSSAVFKAVTRGEKFHSIYNSPDSPDPGWYNPKFESVARRSDRAPEFKPEAKVKQYKILLIPHCMERNLECEYPQAHHTGASTRSSEFYSTLDILRRSPMESDRYDELIERKSRKISLRIGRRSSKSKAKALDFNKMTVRSFKETGAHPERFNYLPSSSLHFSRNKRTTSVDFRKMLNTVRGLNINYTERCYNPNLEFIKPKTKILVPFDKQVPRKLMPNQPHYLPLNLKIDRGLSKLGHMKSVQSLPSWDSMEGRSKPALAASSSIQQFYNSLDDIEMKKFILMRLSRY